MNSPTKDWSSHFGLQNIPFGIAKSAGRTSPQVVSRYLNNVIFLAELEALISCTTQNVFNQTSLNAFAALGGEIHRKVRTAIQIMIKTNSLPPGCVEDINAVHMHLPVSVGDFTDFSCSEYHNLNAGHAVVGRRGLPPTWGYIPPGYAGRSSSIVVSGTPVQRPRGQFWEDAPAVMKGDNKRIVFGPSRMMDYELELGAIIGRSIQYGEAVSANEANDHIFGFVILNDWSARDIQTFEMVPLGPLNSKNTATTMSPWVITSAALEPFRATNKTGFLNIAPHLKQTDFKVLSVDLEINVTASGVRSEGDNASTITTCQCNSSVMAWSFEQLVAHQASAGCGLRSGDLLGIGTVSEEAEGKRGCLLEDNIPALGTSKGFLKDGDIVEFSGYCGEGVGFGECKAQLVSAASGEEWSVG